jgi:hypothetical protein
MALAVDPRERRMYKSHPLVASCIFDEVGESDIHVAVKKRSILVYRLDEFSAGTSQVVSGRFQVLFLDIPV